MWTRERAKNVAKGQPLRKDLNNQRSEERPDCFCPIYSAEPSKECFRVNNAAENQRKQLFQQYEIERNYQTHWGVTAK